MADNDPQTEGTPQIAAFINVLEAAQRGEYPKVEKVAQGINVAELKLAFEKVSAQDEVRIEDPNKDEEAKSEKEAELEDEAQREALGKGFAFATEAINLLSSQPDPKTFLLPLYAYFKIAKEQKPDKPGAFSIGQPKYKYNAWKARNHHSTIKAQQLYIETVDAAIREYGLGENSDM